MDPPGTSGTIAAIEERGRLADAVHRELIVLVWDGVICRDSAADALCAWGLELRRPRAHRRAAADQRGCTCIDRRRSSAVYASPSPTAFPWLAARTAIVLGRIPLDLDNHPGSRSRRLGAT